MRVINLFSGSTGNCTLVRQDRVSVLIDCGGTAREIFSALERSGEDPCAIRAVFLTHEHRDHVSALHPFLKKISVPVYLPCGCLEKAAGFAGDMSEMLVPVGDGAAIGFEGFTVSAFRVPHDSADCFGYRISCPGRTVGVLTDAGRVTERVFAGLDRCSDAIIEANHDVEMVKRNTAYPPSLKSRILSESGHLSNDASARLVAELAADGLKNVMLAHLSLENNTPDAALGAVRNELDRRGLAGVSVSAASADRETELF